MASRPEMLGNRTIGRKKARGVTWGFKPLQASLPLAGRLVGIFRAVSEVPVLAGLHTRQDLPLGRAIAFQLVGNDHPRHVGQPLQQLAEKLLRRFLVATALDENIQDVAILVDGPPQIGAYSLDGEEDLVQMPLIARPGPSAPQLIGRGLPELPAPIAYRFVRQQNAAFCHELFDVAVAEAKTEVEPDTVADDFGREPVARIRVGCGSWGFCRKVRF